MRRNESGQALVLILLSLSVVLTLVLFILSRSVTDVAVSSTQEQSVRAFSAAEAGIERVLVTGSSYTNFPIGNATYTVSSSNFAENLPEFAYPFLFSSGDSATVWFMAHDATGNLTTAGGFRGTGMTVCWGNSGTSDHTDATPAIEISVYYETTRGDLSTIKIARAAFDPFNATGARTVPNSFTAAPVIGPCLVGGENFAFQKNIVFSDFLPPVVPDGLILARIKMFYNGITPHGVGVSVTGGNLPSQGQRVDSSGTAGGSNRRIVVYQGWSESPFSSNSVLSPVEITK